MRKFLVAALLLVPTMAFARGGGGDGFNLGLSTSIQNSTYSGDDYGTSITTTTTAIDAKFGYVFSNSFYLGGLYSTTTISGQTGYSPSVTGMGVTLGYHSNGWIFDATYFLSGTYNDVTAGTNYTNGSGYGVDLGYNFMLSSSFYLGLELDYKSITYAKKEVSSVSTDRNNTVAGYRPMINLGFMF